MAPSGTKNLVQAFQDLRQLLRRCSAEAIPDPAPPELRLPSTIKPLKHDVTLTLDPAAADFTGTITIDLDVAEATSVVWLHGSEITLKRVALGSGSQMFKAKPIYPTKDFIGLVLTKPLPQGHAKLTMEYVGKIHKDDGTGIYTAQQPAHAWLYSKERTTRQIDRSANSTHPSFFLRPVLPQMSSLGTIMPT